MNRTRGRATRDSLSSGMPGRVNSKWLKVVFKALTLALIVWFWYAYVRRNWDQLRNVEIDVNWGLMTASGVVFFLGYFLEGCLWSPFLAEMNGIVLPVPQAFRICALSWVWRYVPGKVWALASRTYLSASDKSQITGIALSVSVEAFWSQATGLLLAAVIFPFYPHFDVLLPKTKLFSLLIAVWAFVIIHPRVFTPIANAILRLLRQPPLTRRPRYRVMILLMAGYMTVFLLWSIGFVIFTQSVAHLKWTDVPLVISIFSSAWALGVFAVFAPAGLGVRDSILALGLSRFSTLAPSTVVVLVVGSRLMTTLVELVCLLVALVIPRSGGLPSVSSEIQGVGTPCRTDNASESAAEGKP